MGRTIFWTMFTVLFFSLFEAAILSNLAFLPVVPDLVLLAVVFVSFMNSPVTGTTAGFFSGLLLDFFSAAPVGLNAFTKTVTGYVAGRLSGSFNLNRLFIPALMGFAATIFKAFLTWLLSLFFGDGILTYHLYGGVFWMEVLANTLCAPPVFALLALFSPLFVDTERHHA